MKKINDDYFSILEQLVQKGAYPYEFEKIPVSAKVEYLKKSNNISTHLIYSIGFKEFVNLILSFQDDADKCKYLLNLYSSTHDDIFLDYIVFINDNFYKMKLREVHGASNFDEIIPEFIKKRDEYNNILAKIKSFNTEDEIYNYISTIENKDIKQLFFYKTEDLTKRQIIVDSIKEDIPEDMIHYTKAVQKMIIDYFENNSNGLFTEKERQELQMIFRRTKVMCVEKLHSPTEDR